MLARWRVTAGNDKLWWARGGEGALAELPCAKGSRPNFETTYSSTPQGHDQTREIFLIFIFFQIFFFLLPQLKFLQGGNKRSRDVVVTMWRAAAWLKPLRQHAPNSLTLCEYVYMWGWQAGGGQLQVSLELSARPRSGCNSTRARDLGGGGAPECTGSTSSP